MNNIIVSQSPSINVTDTVKYHNDKNTFNLDDKNNTDGELILIYMYILPKFQSHGIKVGMAKCRLGETFWHAIRSRISIQKHELALTSEQYEKYGYEREVVYWGICLDAHNDSFKDYSVHDKIKFVAAGLIEKEQEWFQNIPVDELINCFNKVRKFDENKIIYSPRKEQQDCINAIKEYFDKYPRGRFLLNCKMRFGKSYTTYKYCEEAGIDKILILTFIPAVESSWKEDLAHIEKNYRYFTDDNLSKDDFVLGLVQDPYVVFLSLQNYLGKDKDSDVKAKIAQLQDVDWDLVILDEYHFGAWNQKTQETFEDLNSNYQKELKKNKNILGKLEIKVQKTICLSGTPFKVLAKAEFNKETSFTYSYFDEQRNKYPKSDINDFSEVNKDYAQFPDMKIFGYNMSKLFANLTSSVFSDEKILNRKFFSLNKFFETRQENNSNEPCTFIYEEEIKNWLDIIKGKSVHGSQFPFSDIKMINNNKHTLWLMPSVKSCEAIEHLLLNDDYFNRYQIINLSKDGVGTGVDAFKYLQKEITTAENIGKLGSIAITVNKLTIGVTVKKWSSVFVLKDLASPEQYFQSIFRIQTPYKIGNDILKKDGYVYDFNIDRASALLLKYAEQSEKDGQSTKLQIAKLIVKYMPIFVNGDWNSPISDQVFYELAQYGDSSGIPLSKKISDTSKTTRMLDEETVASMLNDPEVSAILKKVFAHTKFSKQKQNNNGTIPAKPEDGFNSIEAKKGRDLGYNKGQEDYKKYVDYDDKQVQEEFENAIETYIKEYCPKEFNDKQKLWFENGFKKGYESGVNAPIKKEQCGKEDGIKFVSEVRNKFGEKVQYTKDTKLVIDNFVKSYLNDMNNIPTKYHGMLYKRWYCDSFIRAIRTILTPRVEGDCKSIEDADNVMKHILARLFEFLYISVYRETTFNEIFNNADPKVFLEAVGITKKDFEILNKYKVFQEDVLNNYIHDFFVNESLGSKLNLEDENIKKQYRNSFDWFGFGLESNEEQINKKLDSHDDFMESINEEHQVPKIEINEENITLIDKIINVLKDCKSAKASKIAESIGVGKKEINSILYANLDVFTKDIFFNWRLKK